MKAGCRAVVYSQCALLALYVVNLICIQNDHHFTIPLGQCVGQSYKLEGNIQLYTIIRIVKLTRNTEFLSLRSSLNFTSHNLI